MAGPVPTGGFLTGRVRTDRLRTLVKDYLTIESVEADQTRCLAILGPQLLNT
jgi:hypothetical protein